MWNYWCYIYILMIIILGWGRCHAAKSFSPRRNLCGNHELIFSGQEVKSGLGIIVRAMCSRATVNAKKKKTETIELVPSTLSGFASSGFHYSLMSRVFLVFLNSHLPAWPLDSCLVCQLVASGTWGEETLLEKRGRGPVWAVQAHWCLSSTPTVL